MSDFEERGNYYLQKKTVSHSSSLIHYWEVGEIIRLNGVERYHASNDFAGRTREEALKWIDEQR